MQRFLRSSLLYALQLVFFTSLFGEKLRVATYNVNNYLVMDRMVGSHWRPSYPKPESEKVILRQIIKAVSPDILVLQEMGSIDFLEELRADMAREGIYYNYVVHLRGADRDRQLAVLSRHAPQKVVEHKDLNFKYFEAREVVKRGMLEMSFELDDGQTFQLFAVHLKSRYAVKKEDEGSEMRRVREAEACRNRIIERTHDIGQGHYMILGDFNDHPSSASLRRFYRRGDLEIGTLVPAADSRGEVWTYYFDNEARYEAVDGIIASPLMMPRVMDGRAYIVDSAGALSGSDHRMVYLDLVEESL